MRAIYLTGELIYLRAMVASDKDHAAAWFPGPFPIDASRAEAFLKESHENLFARERDFAIVRRSLDEITGGAHVSMTGNHARVRLRTAPWVTDGASLRAEALDLLARWLVDESEHVTATFEIPADDAEVIERAQALGLVHGARLREFIARPGGRVDLLLMQKLNPYWVERERQQVPNA